MKRLAVIGALAALCAAGAGVGTSSATFTAHDEFSGSITTAADWVDPALTLTTPADDSYVKSTTATVSGAAGNAAGDSTTVTVNLYSGSTTSGTPTQKTVTRSGASWSTTFTSLAQGTYTVQATQTDAAGNTATTSANTFTVDSIAPTRTSIAAANGSTGTSGHLDAGDTVTFTYSERINPSSILTGWNGSGATPVKVRFFSVGGGDTFTVLDNSSAANVKLDSGTTNSGGVSLGSASYVTGQVTFSATLSQSADGKSFVVTLANPDAFASRVNSSRVTGANISWTPKAGPTDLAGNAMTNVSVYTETGSGRDF